MLAKADLEKLNGVAFRDYRDRGLLMDIKEVLPAEFRTAEVVALIGCSDSLDLTASWLRQKGLLSGKILTHGVIGGVPAFSPDHPEAIDPGEDIWFGRAHSRTGVTHFLLQKHDHCGDTEHCKHTLQQRFALFNQGIKRLRERQPQIVIQTFPLFDKVVLPGKTRTYGIPPEVLRDQTAWQLSDQGRQQLSFS